MSDFKEWAMARKAQSLTGKERIAETYQETNARKKALQDAETVSTIKNAIFHIELPWNMENTTPYAAHLDSLTQSGSIVHPPVPNNRLSAQQQMESYQKTMNMFPNLNRLEVDRDLALHPEKNTATDFYTNAAVDQLKQQAKAASSVPIEGAGTEKMDQPSVEETNSVLDYAGYTAQKLGAGTVGTVGSLEGGLRQTAQDLISGGKVSSDFQKIERFLQENPLERSMIDGQGRIMNEGMVQSIADRIGVLPASLQTYLITTEPERIDRSIEQSHPGLNDTYKSVVGQGAYMLGQQVPGLLLGAIAPVGQAGGIVKSAVGAARTGGARAALSAAAKSAVRGNLTTQLIGASSYSQSLQQNARQYGVRPETYADAIADGMVDAMTEGLFDNASVAALKNMLGTATGSASKTLMKQLLRYALTGAEEGLEEVVAGPLQGLSEKIFLDRDKKWFGDGGVFDVNQMMKDGVAGAAMGLLLGGIGSVVSAYDAIQTSRDIASNVEQINASAQKLDPEFRPETRNPASQTVESATEYAAEVLSGFAEQAQKMQQEARRVGASEADTSQPADSRLEQSQQKQGEARFSIQYDRDNNPYVLVEDDILEGVPRNEWVRTVKDNLRQMFPNGVTVGNNVIEINAQSRNEMTYSGYTKHLMRTEPELYADKLRAINNSDEVLRASRNYVNEALAHPRRDNIQEFARGEVLMQVGDKGYSAQVVVAMRSNGKLLLYDILQMEPAKIQINNKKSNAVIAKNPSPGTDRSTASGFNTNISEIGSGVNGNLAFRQTGERTELPPLRSRDDNTNSSSGVLWAGSESGRLQSGLAAGEYNAALSRQERRVLDQLAKDLRVRVEIGAPTGGQANGWYQDGTVHIAADAEDPFLVVGAHEITHRMQELAPEEYRRYRDYAVGRALEETGGLVEQYRDRYAKAGVELGIEEAMDEIAADYTRRLVEQPGLFEQMARDDRSLAQRILDALLDFLDRVRARFSSQQSRNEAAQVVYRTDLQTLEEAERLWRRAYDAASQQVDSLSTEQDNDTIDITRNSLKGAQNHERRKETRRAFLRRAAGEGYSIFEGDRVAYGYRTVQRESAQENAKQIQKEIEALGIDANIISGPILWNLDGITSIREVPQAVTVGGQHIFISNIADIPPRNVAGHEAFHLWKNRMGRTAYIEIVEDNLIFTSQDFLEYQSAIAEAYLGEEVDLSNDAQVRKLREELFAYISGDIHEGVNDAFMRPMFRDFDTVKSAWGRLVRENSDEAVNENLFFGKSGRKTEMQQGLEKALSEKKRRFSLKSPIEGSADLIALHNLTEQNLLDALRLGGMPMPSIAVTKTDLPHLEFGDITLVLDKNSIDPGADSRNRVYGADIGSPTAPEEAQTLEEIVEAMKQSRRLPEGVGAMSLQAAVAPSYESLQQLWQDSGRLGRMEGPEFQADLEAVNRQIEEILRQVRQGQVDAEAADAAVALRNAAGSTKTEQAIAQSFAEDGYALDSKLVAQIQAAFQAAAELPTEYFEAKPERVVGFDEVLAAVVPDDSSRELLAGLDAAGVQTLRYRAGDDADRVEQVNSVQQARFSPGSAQKRTRRTNSDSGVIWAGSDTSQSASRPAPLRRSQSNSSSGVLWRGSETAMDSPDQAVYNEAGKGQSTSSSNSSSGILWAGSEKTSGNDPVNNLKEVNIYGKINTELDEVDLVNRIIYEDKSAVKLYMDKPDVPQTEAQWAAKQIYRKGSNRIKALQQIEFTLSVNGELLDVNSLKSIKNFVFRIDADTQELKAAVQQELNNLKADFPDYNFSATYGGKQ